MTTVVLALGLSSTALAQKKRMRDYKTNVDLKLESMMADGQKCNTNLNDSEDGKGMDLEIVLDMDLKDFEKMAPVAALEAAAIPHKFPAVNIYLRHAGTGRTGRINFRDADRIVPMYKAGEKDKAIDRISREITWH